MDLDLRAVFVLYELEELTVPMIAELLELKLGTVSSRLRRAREFFKELTREEGWVP
jgi:RNA polymerase sigma-70 factor, ECF subfamily